MTNTYYVRALTRQEQQAIFSESQFDPNDPQHQERVGDYLSTTEWFNTHQEIMKITCNNYQEDLLFILRNHLEYIEKELRGKMQKMSELAFDFSMEPLIQELANELEAIVQKTIIFDFRIVNKGKSFQDYIHYFEGENLEVFFVKYPELSKLLSLRVSQILQRFDRMFMNIIQHKEVIQRKFLQKQEQLSITALSMSNSDSHNGGKVVLFFEINQHVQLVYKEKNLQIVEKYNCFIMKLKKKNDRIDLLGLEGIYEETFAIERMIAYQSCENQEELTNYFDRFGQLVAVMYLLNGKDLHFENIIISQGYPVPIDLESLISPLPEREIENAEQLIVKKISESILQTGLLPDMNTKIKGIDTSVLNTAEIIEIETNVLVDRNREGMRIEKKTMTIPNTNHIVKLEEVPQAYEAFSAEILAGFRTVLWTVLEKKEEIAEELTQLFSNVFTRIIPVHTQKYGEILLESLQPKYLIDSTYRENYLTQQISNRATVYSHLNVFEIRDLSQLDIPLFMSNTSSKGIYDSTEALLGEYYQEKPIDYLLQRIKNLTFSEIEFQENLFQNSLHPSIQNYGQLQLQLKKSSVIELIQAVLAELLENMVVHKKVPTVSWLARSQIDSNEETTFEPISLNMYEGLLGIYLFVYYSNKVGMINEKEWEKQIWATILFHFEKEDNRTFLNLVNLLYLLIIKYNDEKSEELWEMILSLIEEVSQMENSFSPDDLLVGKAGFLVCLATLYSKTKNNQVLEAAKKNATILCQTTNQTVGLAHGISGIVFALYCYYKNCEESSLVMEKIQELLETERKNKEIATGRWFDCRKDKKDYISLSWCNGEVGIALSRIGLMEMGYNEELLYFEAVEIFDHLLNTELSNDTICHGNLGSLSFLISLIKSDFFEESLKVKAKKYQEKIIDQLLNENISLSGVGTFCEFGLYTGISGLGFTLLRVLYPDKIPDFLLLHVI